MAGKRKARMAYYEGVKNALEDHIRKTEEGIQGLPRLSPSQKDRLVASVRKHDAKLVEQVDRNMAIAVKS